MERNGERRSSAGRRALVAAIVLACTGLVALPLAAPLLYLQVGESRLALDAVLRRSRTVRQAEAARIERVRTIVDERLRQTDWAREEALASLEAAAELALARPRNGAAGPARLPWVPALRDDGNVRPATEAVPDSDEIVSAWVADMTRSLGLTAGQQARCREVASEYLAQTRLTMEEERHCPSGRGLERLGNLQDRTTARIRSFLTSEQRLAYERLERNVDLLKKAGVVVPPLPGVRVAGGGRR